MNVVDTSRAKRELGPFDLRAATFVCAIPCPACLAHSGKPCLGVQAGFLHERRCHAVMREVEDLVVVVSRIGADVEAKVAGIAP